MSGTESFSETSRAFDYYRQLKLTPEDIQATPPASEVGSRLRRAAASASQEAPEGPRSRCIARVLLTAVNAIACGE